MFVDINAFEMIRFYQNIISNDETELSLLLPFLHFVYPLRFLGRIVFPLPFLLLLRRHSEHRYETRDLSFLLHPQRFRPHQVWLWLIREVLVCEVPPLPSPVLLVLILILHNFGVVRGIEEVGLQREFLILGGFLEGAFLQKFSEKTEIVLVIIEMLKFLKVHSDFNYNIRWIIGLFIIQCKNYENTW